eukprot:scaffold269_cov123-Isochrysis_galbana.AAC.9
MNSPRSTSGAVHAGAPARDVRSGLSGLRWARPKSHTLARPKSSSSTLALFRSRWRMGGLHACK